MKLKKSVKDKLREVEDGILITEINELFKFFDRNFVEKLTPNKVPENLVGQNCIVLLQTNLYRMKSLVKGYMEGLNKNTPLLSTLCLRAIYETTGSLAFLHKKYNQYANGKLQYESFIEALERLYLGIKDKGIIEDSPDPINVMTLIDSVDYYLKNNFNIDKGEFRKSYDDLSERCHPNSFGYLLGHNVDDKHTIHFVNDYIIHDIVEYDLEYFSIVIKLYQQIYSELRRMVGENEEIPFDEYHVFKQYWNIGF